MTKIVIQPNGLKVIEIHPVFDSTMVVRKPYKEISVRKNKPKVQEEYIEPDNELKDMLDALQKGD